MKTEIPAVKHEMTLAINVGHWHYSFRNHSALFECAHCKKQQRRNTNFLGNRFELQCDGVKFHRMPRQKKEFYEFCDMHQPLEFTPEELQRMDDERGEREVYRIEDSRDDNSNSPEVE